MPADAPFLVSARKYRPQTFSDLVAQDHVAETLRNAIRSDRLAHAYLFCGPRGVGKTTAARILAKAVNCEKPVEERPDLEPCRACTSCLDFEAGKSLNMIEIDAASHNGVDYMRDLRDSIRIPPQGARKKVYVLDEVHMLSSGAFNALLKTLEEPPPHALFIFATTEPHKVLPTILSRTQRFDFRRIAVPEIVAQLRSIATDEHFSADDESLILLARKADGAMRDALSLFDQAIALCGTTLEGEALRKALGVVGSDQYFGATECIAASDRAALIHAVDAIVRRGHDLREFMLGLADHLRNLLVAAATGSADLIEGTDATRRRYLEAARQLPEATLLHCLMIADDAVGDLKDGPHPRLSLELALLKMASLASSVDLAAIVNGVKNARPPAPGSPAPSPVGARQPRRAPDAPSTLPPHAYAPGAASRVVSEPAAPTDPNSGEIPPSEEPDSVLPPRHLDRQANDASPHTDQTASLANTSRPSPALTAEVGQTVAAESESPPSATSGQGSTAVPRRDLVNIGTVGQLETEVAPGTTNPESEQDKDSVRDSGSSSAADDSPEVSPAGIPPAVEPSSLPGSPAPTPVPGNGLFGPPALSLRSPQDDSDVVTAVGNAGQPVEDVQVASGDGAASDAHFGPSLDALRSAWKEIANSCQASNGVRLGTVLRQGHPVRLHRGHIEIGLSDAFACSLANQHADEIGQIMAPYLGEANRPLSFVVAAENHAAAEKQNDPFEALKKLRQEHPVVRALFDRFGAEIVWT